MHKLNSESFQVPGELSERIGRVHGSRGREWLSTLPSLVVECRERWSLELESPFKNLSYNLVIPGHDQHGAEIVVKFGVPCPELITEISALALFDGVGAVRILDHDLHSGILLMERALPGIPLYKLQKDPEATRTAARLMRRLWHEPPPGHSFPTLALWFQAFERLRIGFDGGSVHLPPEILERAECTFHDLDTSSEQSVILHGDLHHENILSSVKSGWLAIDPKGICGDPGYEIGSFMLNQLPVAAPEFEIREILNMRLSVFSEELQIRRDRLVGWAFCHAVLSAAWNFEESAEWSGTIHLAKLLEQL